MGGLTVAPSQLGLLSSIHFQNARSAKVLLARYMSGVGASLPFSSTNLGLNSFQSVVRSVNAKLYSSHQS